MRNLMRLSVSRIPKQIISAEDFEGNVGSNLWFNKTVSYNNEVL